MESLARVPNLPDPSPELTSDLILTLRGILIQYDKLIRILDTVRSQLQLEFRDIRPVKPMEYDIRNRESKFLHMPVIEKVIRQPTLKIQTESQSSMLKSPLCTSKPSKSTSESSGIVTPPMYSIEQTFDDRLWRYRVGHAVGAAACLIIGDCNCIFFLRPVHHELFSRMTLLDKYKLTGMIRFPDFRERSEDIFWECLEQDQGNYANGKERHTCKRELETARIAIV